MTAAPLPPIVPLADLVAELRAMHSIPCLTAADRLEEMDREMRKITLALYEWQLFNVRRDLRAIDALPELPPCPTCGGKGERQIGYTRNLTEFLTERCPDCVDGHVTWQRCVNVFNAVFGDEPLTIYPKRSSMGGVIDATLAVLRAIR